MLTGKPVCSTDNRSIKDKDTFQVSLSFMHNYTLATTPCQIVQNFGSFFGCYGGRLSLTL